MTFQFMPIINANINYNFKLSIEYSILCNIYMYKKHDNLENTVIDFLAASNFPQYKQNVT